jgi:hypothetical protein
MKITEGLKRINDGWVVKPKGFRVRFQMKKENTITTEHSPGLGESPLESDVVAWRYAWKLDMATRSQGPDIQEGEMVNITVVNDQGSPVSCYATNRMEVYNAKPVPDAETLNE